MTEEQKQLAKRHLEMREGQAKERGTDPRRVYHTNPDGRETFHWELTCLGCGKRFETILVEDTECLSCRTARK